MTTIVITIMRHPNHPSTVDSPTTIAKPSVHCLLTLNVDTQSVKFHSTGSGLYYNNLEQPILDRQQYTISDRKLPPKTHCIVTR